MKNLIEKIRACSKDFETSDHEWLHEAQEHENPRALQSTAQALVTISDVLLNLADTLEYMEKYPKEEVSVANDSESEKSEEESEDEEEKKEAWLSVADELVSFANMLDKSEDIRLQKRAQQLDQMFSTLTAMSRALAEKRASEAEEKANELRAEQREQGREKAYVEVKAKHDEWNQVDDTRKRIEDKVKTYRHLEAPLSTRSCPDHPGQQMSRVGDDVYQCSLDLAIYNFRTGFTTMKGDKVPGGDVTYQTDSLYTGPNESVSFDSRDSRLNG